MLRAKVRIIKYINIQYLVFTIEASIGFIT